MKMIQRSLLTLTAAVFCAAPGLAEDVPNVRDTAEPIVERRTVPYPYAVDRRPLTSDQLSTTSTRLIDARRGFRPYPAYDGYPYAGYRYDRVIYNDSFGIIRQTPYTLSLRKPATGVSTTINQTFAQPTSADDSAQSRVKAAAPIQYQPPMRVVVLDERKGAVGEDAVNNARENEDVDVVLRVHRNAPAPVTESGTAVLIKADGTVIEIR